MGRAATIRLVTVFSAMATLCVTVAGCVSDAGAPLSAGVASGSGDNAALRYYGGPKSPMWPDR